MHRQLDEWQAEGIQLFGPNPNQWEFVCPDCGAVQRPQDFLDLGLHQRQVDIIAAFACIGRWKGTGCMSAGRGPVLLIISEHEQDRPTFDWNRP